MLEIKNLTKIYKGEKAAVENLSLPYMPGIFMDLSDTMELVKPLP